MKKTIFILMSVFLILSCEKQSVEKSIDCVILANDTIANNVQSTISATFKTENTSIAKVELFIDGVSNKTLFASPFDFKVTLNSLTTGSHVITINATTVEGNSKTFTKNVFFKVNLGDVYMGGIVISLSSNKVNGIIASTSDLTGGVLGLYKYGAYNGNYQAYSMDDGLSNTNKFVGKFDSNYAAIACLNLTYNGYSDWYLPALNELLLFENYRVLLNIPERSGNVYWSSTESSTDVNSAYSHSFGGMLGQPCDKQKGYYVRPVRKF